MRLVISDGRATGDFPVPTTLQMQGWARDYVTPGYLVPLPMGQSFRVEKQSEPIDFHFKAIPAGLVHGEVCNADGKLAREDFAISVIDVQQLRSPTAGSLSNQLPTCFSREGSAEYVLHPLPLNVNFRLLLKGNTGAVISDEFRLESASPIRTIPLKLALTAKSITGRIMTPAAQPLPKTNLMVYWKSPWGEISMGQATTDAQGNFVVEKINPDLPGSIELSIAATDEFPGQRVPVVAGQVINYQIPAGLQLEGVVVDAATGKPIPNARVSAKSDANVSSGNVTADDHGYFRLKNLAPGEYLVQVMNTVPEGAVITKLPNGGYTVTYPGNTLNVKFRAGGTEPALVKVQPLPTMRSP